jgi:hypothetical protein
MAVFDSFGLKNALYQIPLARESLKYCEVSTPFKGIRVYTRCAMGMPGSEMALEELRCRILGDLLQEGIICKLANDFYCGGDTPEQPHFTIGVVYLLHSIIVTSN